MFKLIGEIVFVYFLYMFIFKFVIPLYKASKQMKGTFNDMQSKMKAQQDAQYKHNTPHEPTKKPTQTAKGDYIDYEEVR